MIYLPDCRPALEHFQRINNSAFFKHAELGLYPSYQNNGNIVALYDLIPKHNIVISGDNTSLIFAWLASMLGSIGDNTVKFAFPNAVIPVYYDCSKCDCFDTSINFFESFPILDADVRFELFLDGQVVFLFDNVDFFDNLDSLTNFLVLLKEVVSTYTNCYYFLGTSKDGYRGPIKKVCDDLKFTKYNILNPL